MLAEAPSSTLYGRAEPRLAPPVPLRHGLPEFRRVAADIGYALLPWQECAASYLTATDGDDRWAYREVAVVVSRQNGKTTLLVPLIYQRLLDGHRVMHTAQDRSLPREVFYLVAELMWANHPELFPLRNGRPTKPRYANGQEEIRLTNGGIYSIVAPSRGGARGPSRDLVIIDELREMEAWDFIAAAKPTLTASRKPQMLYLSNAGEETSIVLNALRERRDSDPSLAYLEWSADPDRRSDDPIGWTEANPAMGHEPESMGPIQPTLEAEHRTAALEGTMAKFETEHLCRWVVTTRRRLVDEYAWNLCESSDLGTPRRPVMGVSMDPSGTRASVALAWLDGDEVRLRLLYDVPGDPIDTAALGEDLRATAREHGVIKVAYDPMTDAELAKYFKKVEPISGAKFANASAQFVNLVMAQKLRWSECAPVTDDLIWTARKVRDEGTFEAVRANDDRPVTAALAAVRAVWMASGHPQPVPKVY
jgi:hypothetical protein